LNPENFLPPSHSSRKPLRILAALLLIFVLAFSLVYFIFIKKSPPENLSQNLSQPLSQPQALNSQSNISDISNTQTLPGTLIFAIDVIRHGDRTPTSDPFSPPETWSMGLGMGVGLGQLTPTGMHQEYELGQNLRETYINQTHLLPENYQAGSLYIESTDYDRTLMSATALLAGLYPLGTGPSLPPASASSASSSSKLPALPEAQQPIPIHIFPIDQQNKIIPDSNPIAYQKLLQTYVFKTPEWINKENALKANFPSWSHILGVPITQLYDLKNIADTLSIQKLYGVKYPAGLSPQDADKIIEAGQWAFVKGFENPTVGKISGHYFLNLISQKISQKIKSKSQNQSPAYILYSTHDSVILSLLSAMGAPLNQIPPYASDLNFEVFEIKDNKSGQSKEIIQVKINGTPLSLPACKAKPISNSPSDSCSLSEFLAMTAAPLKHTLIAHNHQH
jgi:hypothetical protein